MFQVKLKQLQFGDKLALFKGQASQTSWFFGPDTLDCKPLQFQEFRKRVWPPNLYQVSLPRSTVCEKESSSTKG